MSKHVRASGQIEYETADALDQNVEYLTDKWGPVKIADDVDPSDAAKQEHVIACVDAQTLVIPDRQYRDLVPWVPGLMVGADNGAVTLTVQDDQLAAKIVRPELVIRIDLIEWGRIACDGPLMKGQEVTQQVLDAFHKRFDEAGLPPTEIVDRCSPLPVET